MHMADALLSPTVGIAMWVASGTALAVASRRVRARDDDRLVPLMGVLGAFVFAAQMINFTIPATGSSGHLGGGLLLAILLGPARRVRRHRLGADGAGAVLRRRRPAGAGRQHVQPRRAALLRGLPADLPAAGRGRRRRGGALALAAVVAATRGPAARRARRGAADHAVRHLEPAAEAVPDADAADPPGDRRGRGAGHRGPACCSCAARGPTCWTAQRAVAGPCRIGEPSAGGPGAGGAAHRRRAVVVRLHAARRAGVVGRRTAAGAAERSHAPIPAAAAPDAWPDVDPGTIAARRGRRRRDARRW